MAKNLAELQAALQIDIMHGQGHTLPRLSVPKNASAKERLLVYQNAYVIRLGQILCEDYDTTWTFLGDDQFNALARAYIHAHPSDTPNARFFTDKFPEFLETQPIGAEHPAVPGIARLERALRDAFDAGDDPVIGPEDLATVGAENFDKAVFHLHPSVTLMRLGSNGYDVLCALRDEADPPAPERRDPGQWIAVWRRELTCRHVALEQEEGTLLDLAHQGHSFAQLCEASALFGDPDNTALRMAGFLQQWIANHMLSAISVAPDR